MPIKKETRVKRVKFANKQFSKKVMLPSLHGLQKILKMQNAKTVETAYMNQNLMKFHPMSTNSAGLARKPNRDFALPIHVYYVSQSW